MVRRAEQLLARAREAYDVKSPFLADHADVAWQSGFQSGAEWMRLALGALREADSPKKQIAANRIGMLKYGISGIPAGLCLLTGHPVSLIFALFFFYLLEAQMVFLFPLALDGSRHPFSESRDWTQRAGGTFSVMTVIIPIALSMIFGGFLGRGFVRSWSLGCLAVCIWYEELRMLEN